MRCIVLTQLTKDADVLLNEKSAAFPDYSEEAIPERDPAYRLLDGTLSDAQTVDAVSPAVRSALADRLRELGMGAAKAAIVANL
jgi:hypothetical protein